MSSPDRFWVNRLRWRLRGALQWPAFVVLTLLDGLVLDLLPPVATTNLDFIQGVLIAAFGNLFLLGALAPFLTRRLVVRRAAVAGAEPAPVVEREVLQDRVAAALLALGLIATIASGLANRPVVVSETQATERLGAAVREYVGHTGDRQLEANLETANTRRMGEDYFRTCIPADKERTRLLCLLVDTSKDPVAIKRDPSVESNEQRFGPE